MTLNELKDGQRARVVSLSALSSVVRKKLMIMGVLPQTPITMIRRAPMGDPLQIEVRGVFLALRGENASDIEVEIA